MPGCAGVGVVPCDQGIVRRRGWMGVAESVRNPVTLSEFRTLPAHVVITARDDGV